MFKPKVKFIYNDPITEAQLICFKAKDITHNRYQKSSYIVLPYLISKNSKTVHFPDFPYSQKFWQLIQKCKNEDYGKAFPPNAIKEIVNHLKKAAYTQTEISEIKQLVSDWKKKQNSFINFINKYYDQKSKFVKIKNVTVLITKYGNSGSFNLINHKNGTKEIVATLRIDFEIDTLAKTILKAIYLLQTRKRAEVGEIPFYERQKAVEYLFQNSKLSTIFPKTKESVNKSVSEKLLKDSKLFLSKLGYPPELPFRIKNNKIYFDKKNVDTVLTEQEKDILTGLITKKGELLSFDEASEIVWKENSFEKFSLFSLAKIVENLRRKFRQLGLNSEMIKTVRNRGYLLNP